MSVFKKEKKQCSPKRYDGQNRVADFYKFDFNQSQWTFLPAQVLLDLGSVCLDNVLLFFSFPDDVIENDESYADSSFSSENEGEKQGDLRTSCTDESNNDSVFEDNGSNNSQSESDQDSSFYESDTESKFVNAPQQATYIRSFSP